MAGRTGVDGDRNQVEAEILAELFGRGPAAVAELARTPAGSLWFTGPRRLIFDGALEVASQGLAVTPAAVAEAVEPLVGVERAAEVRQAAELAVEAYGGEHHAGRLAHLVDALAELRDSTQVETQGGAATLPHPLPASHLLDATFPPIAFAIDPYFPRGEVAELVGAHGIFKSTAALAACLSVAAGRCWGPGVVAQGRAAFLTMEDSERTLARRVRAWLDGVPVGASRAAAEGAVRSDFLYLAREQAQELALTAADRNTTTPRAHVVQHLGEVLRGASLVVLETASRLHVGPEMNEGLAIFARAVEEVAVTSGAAVVVVRHVSKQGARDGVTDSYAGRGGGAFSDAARSVLVMARPRRAAGADEEDPDPLAPVRLVHAKSTHTAPGPSVVWRPVASEHGVYLYALSESEEARAHGQRLVTHLQALGGGGVTKTELHKTPPAGLTRAEAKRALDHLLAAGRLDATEEERGKNKARATVYRLAEEVAL